MIHRSPLTKNAVLAALGLLLSIGVTGSSCRKDEEPPPMPSATVEATGPAPALSLAPEEDAGSPDADAGRRGGGAPAQSLKNCCAALKQNAAGAPDALKGYMMAAAGACDAAVASGADRGAALGGIRAAMGGAPLPTACF